MIEYKGAREIIRGLNAAGYTVISDFYYGPADRVVTPENVCRFIDAVDEGKFFVIKDGLDNDSGIAKVSGTISYIPENGYDDWIHDYSTWLEEYIDQYIY